MRSTIALAAAAILLATAPAFAISGHTPQTEFSGPGSVGSIQQQDMERSQAKPDQKVQTPKPAQRDTQDPQMNPRNVRSQR